MSGEVASDELHLKAPYASLCKVCTYSCTCYYTVKSTYTEVLLICMVMVRYFEGYVLQWYMYFYDIDVGL